MSGDQKLVPNSKVDDDDVKTDKQIEPGFERSPELNLVPGTWYQVPGTRYPVPGTWYQASGTWYQVLPRWLQTRWMIICEVTQLGPNYR